MEKDIKQFCGNCSLFADEDVNGCGWCEFHQTLTKCDNSCEDGLFNSKEIENGRI